MIYRNKFNSKFLRQTRNTESFLAIVLIFLSLELLTL